MPPNSSYTPSRAKYNETDKFADTDKLYRKTAILLDQLTDNLAIHQAVGSLDVAMGLQEFGGDSGSGPFRETERDDYQTFWVEVAENQ